MLRKSRRIVWMHEDAPFVGVIVAKFARPVPEDLAQRAILIQATACQDVVDINDGRCKPDRNF